ncbi:Ig-like domain-containing protein [Pseudarthrobacter sp. NPDC089323]
MSGLDGGRRTFRLHGFLTALLLALAALVVPLPASAATGDVGVEGPSHSGTGTPTGTKRSTSNLWFHDGLWWGNLWDTASQDFEIFQFNASTNQWISKNVTTDTRASTHHDVLWDGTILYVASYRFVNDGVPAEPNYPTTLHRFSYNASEKTYTRLGSSQINNYRVEALTIDKEQSSGRLWATWQQGNQIYMNVTGTDGKTWGTPFPHPASLSKVSIDDTSSVIAFGGNKMGVMWSRQVGDSTDGMYWSYHVDGAANTAWSAPVAAVNGARSGDDHMNLKWLDSSSDKVFAAIKTSFTSSSQPLIQLLALDPGTSAWTAHTIATVAECPNRVIVLIDEAAQRLRTFATYPKPSGTTNAGACTSSGGAIYEKSTALSNISFTTTKTPRIVDADQYVHNVTSTKQNLNSSARGTANSGVLLLADVSSTSRYWHYYDPTGGSGGSDTTAPTLTSTSPADGATGVAATANVTGTFSEPMDSSTLTSSTFTLKNGTTVVPGAVSLDGTSKVATLDPAGNLTAGTIYTATISTGAKDLAGNALASAKTWTFTADATPPTVTATAPGDGATGVAVATNVTATFSEAMNGSTVTPSFTLKNGTNAVSASVVLDSTGNVATLNPAADLAAATTYTASISTGARDLAGNALASTKIWTFTTAPAGGSTSQTVTLTATADTYVTSGSAATNFGSSALLAVDNSPISVTYLKFDLAPYAGRTITAATLQLRSSTSGSTGTQNVKLAGEGWSETGITYNTRPAVGAVLGSFGPTTTNANYSVTLAPDGLNNEAGGELSVALDSSSSDGLDLSSREVSSTAAPKLVLTFQ